MKMWKGVYLASVAAISFVWAAEWYGIVINWGAVETISAFVAALTILPAALIYSVTFLIARAIRNGMKGE